MIYFKVHFGSAPPMLSVCYAGFDYVYFQKYRVNITNVLLCAYCFWGVVLGEFLQMLFAYTFVPVVYD